MLKVWRIIAKLFNGFLLYHSIQIHPSHLTNRHETSWNIPRISTLSVGHCLEVSWPDIIQSSEFWKILKRQLFTQPQFVSKNSKKSTFWSWYSHDFPKFIGAIKQPTKVTTTKRRLFWPPERNLGGNCPTSFNLIGLYKEYLKNMDIPGNLNIQDLWRFT